MNKIKITIVKYIKQVKDGYIVKFNSPYGIAEGKWFGTKPKLNFEYYINISISIPEDLEWGKQINVIKESVSELTSDENYTYLSGILESIDSYGYSVLRIGDNYVFFSFDEDLELTGKNFIGSYVKIEAEEICLSEIEKIEIIYDASTRKNSCYIELLPDKYKGKCWNTSSIYFTENNFGYIEPVIEKCYKEFEYYAFNEIEIDTWKLIIQELEKIKQYLADDPNPNSLRDVLGFKFKSSEKRFIENYDTNLKQLISMITDFQSWIKEKSVSTKFICVLGM